MLRMRTNTLSKREEINPVQRRFNLNQQRRRRNGLLAILLATGLSLCMIKPSAYAAGDILNASYDVTRELNYLRQSRRFIARAPQRRW